MVADGVALAVTLAVLLAVAVGDSVRLRVGVAEADGEAVALLVERHAKGLCCVAYSYY